MPENNEEVKEEVTVKEENINTEEPVVSEEENYNTIEPVVNEEENKIVEKVEIQKPLKDNNGEKKLDKKSILLILFFIFLFVFVLEMPRITELVDKLKHSGMNEFQQQAKNIEKRNEKAKEEEKKKEEEKRKNEVEVLNTVKCTLTTDAYSNEYTTTMTNELLVNGNGEVISNNLILQYDYHDTSNTYITNKNECSNSELKTKTIDGFNYMCTSSEVQLKFVYKFELAKVTEVKYTKVDGTDASVAASVKLKQSLTEAKNELIAKGFVCE